MDTVYTTHYDKSFLLVRDRKLLIALKYIASSSPNKKGNNRKWTLRIKNIFPV